MAETQIRLDTQAQDGTLIDSKIAANTISLDKLASIGDGSIIVGAIATGFPAAVTVSGDISLSDTGVTLIQPAVVTGSKIAAATVAGSNIASATITNTNMTSGVFGAITGLGAQSQALNMNTHLINNVVDPVSAQDAATKHYVDTTAATTVLPSAEIFVGNGSNVATAVPMSGDVGIDNTGLTTIQANAIVNSKVSATAAINVTKLNIGTNAQLIISNGTTNAWTTVSGDIAITNTGVTAIQPGVITNTDINPTAAIALSKLADGTSILLADTSASIQNTIRYTYVTAQTFTNPGDLVDKAYVDATASGITAKASCNLATTTALPAYTFAAGSPVGVGDTLTANANGALSVDSTAVVVNNRILVKNEGSGTSTVNGIWVVTATGGVGAPYVLTRSTDFNGSSTGPINSGDFTFVTQGTVNASTGWLLSTPDPIVIDTTPLTWTQFSSAGVVVAGSGLTQVGNVFNVVSDNAGITVNAHSIALTLSDSTLTIDGSGLRLSSLPSAEILIGNGSAVATANAISGDATLSNTGVLTISGSFARVNSFVVREIPTGAINSSNLTYTLANTPVVGSECVFLNGLLQTATVDYNISGAVITFTSGNAPNTGSILVANYQK